jgi:2-polyprenyl-6-methoxyphenol hydroxylase-like FAD-dependent oxidoreductase
MNINIVSNSLLSNISALSLNKCGSKIISIHNNNLKTYGRYYSLNYFSKNFLENINVWQKLSPLNITPYKLIEIYCNNHLTVSFNSSDISINHLGYIVSEDELARAVTETIMENKNLINNLDKSNNNSLSDINIISDYANVDSVFKLEHYQSSSYSQTAININIDHSKENKGIPRQIFYKDEILGFLPTSNNSYNLIWTMPNEVFTELSSKSIDEYLKLLQKRAGFILGTIKDLTVGQSFPLSSRHSDTYYYTNNLLVGEAAHKFHPLAGLGLNMGIEDIHVIATLISNNFENNVIFREYAIKRIFRNSSLQHTLDTIIHYHSSILIPDFFKRLLLKIFDNSIFFKPAIIKNATGSVNIIQSTSK